MDRGQNQRNLMKGCPRELGESWRAGMEGLWGLRSVSYCVQCPLEPELHGRRNRVCVKGDLIVG